MSFYISTPAPQRSSRYQEATFACSRRRPGLGADIVMLDLEDAVAPDDKVQAQGQHHRSR